MDKVKATIHGAVSLVNAIATGKGATLGISLGVNAILESSPGNGIILQSDDHNISSRLVNSVIKKTVPKKELEKNKLRIIIDSEIPTGYGLKSSSAISSVVALGCAKLFGQKLSDYQILLIGIKASLETKVSLTGAYDDACACYYGGFNVTDNYKTKRILYEKAPKNLSVVIFLPKSRKRGNIKNLRKLKVVFDQAWNLAKEKDYWRAMMLNGFATSLNFNINPMILTDLIDKGALSASTSGNGPAIAAVAITNKISNIKKVFSSLEGKTIVSKINNEKAEVHEM
jgi:shikimate kinase